MIAFADEVQACRDGARDVQLTCRCGGQRAGKACGKEVAKVYGSKLGLLFLATWTEPALGGAEGWRTTPQLRRLAPALAKFASMEPRIPDQVHECAELLAGDGELKAECRFHKALTVDRRTISRALKDPAARKVLLYPA